MIIFLIFNLPTPRTHYNDPFCHVVAIINLPYQYSHRACSAVTHITEFTAWWINLSTAHWLVALCSWERAWSLIIRFTASWNCVSLCVCVWKKRRGVGVTSVGCPWLEAILLNGIYTCHRISWQFNRFPLVDLFICTVPILGFSTTILPTPLPPNEFFCWFSTYINFNPYSRILVVHINFS